MDMTKTHTGETVFTGRKELMDAAHVWVRAVYYSLLGPTVGEQAFQQVPALPVLTAYHAALANPVYH